MSAAKSQEAAIAELERAVAYYKKRIDELSGENIKAEYRTSGLRKEIKQKRSAFALLSSLQVAFGKTTSVDQIFKTTIEAISQTLDVDRAFILTPSESENIYSPAMWQGLERLTEERVEGFKDFHFEFPQEFSRISNQFLLNTKASPPSELSTKIVEALDLPFFVCTPIITEERAVGILMMGRLKEVGTAFPPLDMGDVETLRSISGLMSAIIQNMRVGVLQEMDRMKTEFFANLSHEFRTPITLTLGAIDGLVAGRFGVIDNKEFHVQADLMKRNQGRLLNLINQILDLEKLESGNVNLKLQRIQHINGFLKRRLDQFHTLTSKKGIELKYLGDEGLDAAEIFIDPERFDRMLFNLLSNAAKFTLKGSITLETFLTDSHYGLRVTDTGIGIKPSQIALVFDRFRQADGSASREYAGTGIGLSLVKQIAELHGGTVVVKSKFGSGTTFEISSPLGSKHFSANDIIEGFYTEDDASEPTFAPIDIHEGKASTESLHEVEKWNATALGEPTSKFGTLLYVDDNRDLRQYVRDLLKTEFKVFIGVDGKDGLEKALQFQPDLIISDLMMPNMNGEQFLEAVKANSELREIPFVLLTAKSEMESKIANLSKGADDYLNKPFSEPELKARVKNLLTIRKQGQRIRSELLAARGIQRALLPNLDRTSVAQGQVRFEVVYHPCEILSGDFYDVIDRGRRVFFYVADVTSHGTAAAQVTYLVKSYANEIIDKDPLVSAPEFIRRMSEKYDILELNYSVIFQLAILDTETFRVSLVGSGAPPALLKTEKEVSEKISKPGRLIGMPSPSSETQTLNDPLDFELGPGEQLYLFSDGCYEFNILGAKNQYGLRRLSKLIQKLPEENWQEALMNGLVAVKGDANFDDDITVLRLARPR